MPYTPKAPNQYPRLLLIPRLKTYLSAVSFPNTTSFTPSEFLHPSQNRCFLTTKSTPINFLNSFTESSPNSDFLSEILSLCFFIMLSKCQDSHFQWFTPTYLSNQTQCHVFTYSPYLLPITPGSSNAKLLTPLFDKPGSSTNLVPFPFLPFPLHPLILPLGSTRLPFPQDSTPLSLPRPVPPGATYPKFSPHFRPLAPPSPPKEGGGRRERRGAALRKVRTISH